jgi:predicted nucleic acid-binding protein
VTAFADSSALVKPDADESGHERPWTVRARLCAVHALRAYDAVQLACALAARDAVPECQTFAAFDRQLRAAAAAEGFALVPSVLQR